MRISRLSGRKFKTARCSNGKWQLIDFLFDYKSSEVRTLKRVPLQRSSVLTTLAASESNSNVINSFSLLRSIFDWLLKRVGTTGRL